VKLYKGHLLFRTKKATALLEKLPEANILECNDDGVHACAVRWDHPYRVHNVRALTELRMKNIPFVTQDYKFPCERVPFKHQVEMVEFAVRNRKSFNLSTMGVGKTSSSVWACDYLMKHGYLDRVVVVAPLSILKAAWEKDIYTCTPHRSVGIVHGTNRKRVEMLRGQPKDFYIINYDGLTTVEDEVRELTRTGVTGWIVDESTYVKNSATRRFKTLKRLIKPDKDFVLALSGSPTVNSPTDAHGQCLLVNPSSVPRSKERFKVMTMTQVNKFVWIPKFDAKDTVYRVLQPSVRYKKEDCLDLPPVTFSDRQVALTKQQKSFYVKLQRQLIIELENGDVISGASASAAISKLLQIATGVAYITDTDKTIELDCAPRIKELETVISEAATKVVCFVPFRATIEMLERHFKKEYGEDYVRTIRGGVSLKSRSEIVETFADPDSDLKLLLCQPQAASHGLSLVSASVAVWFSCPNNASAETYIQANARLDRPGQEHKVSVVRLSGSGIEDKIYSKVRGKVDDQKSLLELYGELIKAPL
tara:strand:- start:13154 stop:14758 length:1605 start_codon:yes stop_codon:yes gene_type:complete